MEMFSYALSWGLLVESLLFELFDPLLIESLCNCLDPFSMESSLEKCGYSIEALALKCFLIIILLSVALVVLILFMFSSSRFFSV